MNINFGFCEYPKSDYFEALIFAYGTALAVIAFRDDRFLKNYAQFRLMPFSISRFGLAAVANIISAIAFVAIVFAPRNCA